MTDRIERKMTLFYLAIFILVSTTIAFLIFLFYHYKVTVLKQLLYQLSEVKKK